MARSHSIYDIQMKGIVNISSHSMLVNSAWCIITFVEVAQKSRFFYTELKFEYFKSIVVVLSIQFCLQSNKIAIKINCIIVLVTNSKSLILLYFKWPKMTYHFTCEFSIFRIRKFKVRTFWINFSFTWNNQSHFITNTNRKLAFGGFGTKIVRRTFYLNFTTLYVSASVCWSTWKVCLKKEMNGCVSPTLLWSEQKERYGICHRHPWKSKSRIMSNNVWFWLIAAIKFILRIKSNFWTWREQSWLTEYIFHKINEISNGHKNHGHRKKKSYTRRHSCVYCILICMKFSHLLIEESGKERLVGEKSIKRKQTNK